MSYISVVLTVASIHLLALMSPGPDFVLITRNSLLYSKRSGVYTALGLACGIALHVTYSLIGIGLIIAKSVILFSILKFFGAAYLMFIGYKSLCSKPSAEQREMTAGEAHLDTRKALRMGFFTNATNPKATLFFLSVFTLVINPATPLFVKLIMGAEMIAATFLWFSFVSLLVSHRAVKNRVGRFQHYTEKATGFVLIALGLKLSVSK